MDISAEKAYPTPVSNSTLLPLLLLSLATQKHTPNTATEVLEEYDFIIVGGGAAGSVLANRLSEVECINVLLLEAGKPPPILTDLPAAMSAFIGSDVDWNYTTVQQRKTAAGHVPNGVVRWPSGKTLGGSSTINIMLAIRGNRRDFDSWSDHGATGWSYKEVLPYFIDMENYRDPEYRDNDFHGTYGPLTIERQHDMPKLKEALIAAAELEGYKFVDINGPNPTGFYNLTQNLRNGQRCSTAKAYLVPAENRTNLDILPNALVTKVVLNNNRATGVRFQFGNQTYEVRARREVILSAGAAETPKLLMLSGIGPASELQKYNIDVVADLPVGKNLSDHVGVPVNFVLDESFVTPINKRVTNASIMQYISDRSGPLSIANGLIISNFMKNLESSDSLDFPDYQSVIREAVVDDGLKKSLHLTSQIFEQVYEPYRNKPIYICLTYAVNPMSRGSVKLQSAKPEDLPIFDPNYFDDDKDLENTISGMKTCLKMGTSSPLLKLGSQPFQTKYPECEPYDIMSDDYLRCTVKTICQTIFHKCGTAKMGNPKDPSTVVDPQLRVKTIHGLRVVDASVFPSITSGNIHLPTIMVAEKAADIIKKDIRCSPSNCGVKLLKIQT